MASSASASFFLMGCWNNDNCRHKDPTRPKGIIGSNDGRDYRRAVIEAIGRASPRYDFGLVAGDNIYPRMPTVPKDAPFKHITKTYFKKTLDYGFSLLDALKIPYYTALGNHDVVKNEVLQAEIKKGHLTTLQFVRELVPGKLRLVVLDTNLLQLNLTEPTKRHYGIQTAADGWRTVRAFLDTVWATAFPGWTMVMGHEPILTMKKKGLVGLVYYKELIGELLRIPKVVYVCADLHAFQVSELRLDGDGGRDGDRAALPMVVVGTGGANPDTVKTPEAPIAFQGGTWRIHETMPAYGYGEGKLRGNQLTLTFLPLTHCTPGQQKVRVVFRAKQEKNAMEVQRMGRRIAYDPDKCAARPVRADLCVNDPSKNPPLKGVGQYVRREYKINQKK